MADNETIADIIAQMRRIKYNGEDCTVKWCLTEWADRLEAALKREMAAYEQTMTKNPHFAGVSKMGGDCAKLRDNWKEICAKCKDGDIEPKHCEYYGEPNGCNSPIYGEHPTAEKSSAAGDAAKLREASGNALWCLNWMYENTGDQAVKDHLAKPIEILAAVLAAPATTKKSSAVGDCAKLREALEKINSLCGIGVVEISSFEIGSICDAALAAPPRNCDVLKLKEGRPGDMADQVWRAYKNSHMGSYLDVCDLLRCIGWLLAPATEKKGGSDGNE